MATGSVNDPVTNAAKRLRAQLEEAKEGHYYTHAWYAHMNKLDIEILIESVIGPEAVEVEEVKPAMMTVQAFDTDGTLIWEGEAPMDSIRVSPGKAEFSLDPDTIKMNENYTVELGADEPTEKTTSFRTGTGQTILNVHSDDECDGRGCAIHHPSAHHMREWPTNFRDGGWLNIKPAHMERMCTHGVGHPDPDDVAYFRSRGEDISVHGCDGCCRSADAARAAAVIGETLDTPIPRLRRPIRDIPQA